MSHKQERIAWPLLALLGLAVASVFLVRARSQTISLSATPRDPPSETLRWATTSNAVSHEKNSSSTGSVQPGQGNNKERGPVQTARFTLFKQGIYPREIRVREGLINLAIEDKTNNSSGLIVEREVGNHRISLVKRFENQLRGRELLRLTPGKHVVFDSSRPGNQARLVVEP